MYLLFHLLRYLMRFSPFCFSKRLLIFLISQLLNLDPRSLRESRVHPWKFENNIRTWLMHKSHFFLVLKRLIKVVLNNRTVCCQHYRKGQDFINSSDSQVVTNNNHHFHKIFNHDLSGIHRFCLFMTKNVLRVCDILNCRWSTGTPGPQAPGVQI